MEPARCEIGTGFFIFIFLQICYLCTFINYGMKRLPYLYITFAAMIAVLILQFVWFAKNYRMLEDELFYQLNKAFIEAIGKENTKRYEEHASALGQLPASQVALFYEIAPAIESKVRWHKPGEENINEFMAVIMRQELLFKMDSIGICKNIPNYAMLDSIFYEELTKAGFNHPKFRIDSGVPINPEHYPYLNDLVFDSARIKNMHRMTTSVCPSQIQYQSGYQGVLLNPQKEIIRQLDSFLWGSLLLSTIIIFCVWQQIHLILRQKKIAQQCEDFSYAMIHDMKTPLSSILVGVRILQSGKLDDKPEKRERYISILKDEGNHLLSLSNKVLNLSKLEKHELKLNKEEVHLKPLIEDLVEKFSAKATKPVHFFVNLQAETAFADSEYLKEAISNLIDNAIKYSKESVDIHISTRTDIDGILQISIKDNGIGISPKEQRRIFEKFERSVHVRHHQKNSVSGFGLGLNYVYHIIKVHGGSVSLTSTEGQYSEFTINLPSTT